MSDATEARAIEHPNGKTARLVVFPQTGSQLPITPDEDLIVALDDERKMLWAELEAARRALASPPNGAERDAQDARRYRVLRDGEWEEFDSAWLCKVDIYGQGPADLDAAIDAALTP